MIVRATVVYSFLAAGASAQPATIQDCASKCSLAMELVGTFGDDAGPGMIEGGEARGFVHGDGRVYLIDGPSTSVKVYDSTGAFLERIGRRGEGPGEFSFIAFAVAIADRMAVLDATGRLQLFDSAHKLVGQTRLSFIPTGRNATYVKGLGLVVAADVRTAERAGLPLHLVDLDSGGVESSFGSVAGEDRVSDVGPGQRAVAEGPDGSIWAARVWEYRIELWTPDGLQRSMARDAAWFPPATRSTVSHGWFERPSPSLVDLAASASQLWVKLKVADPRWREAGETQDWDIFQDTIIEVIDIHETRVIGRVRLDEAYGDFIAPGLIGKSVITPSGSVRYELYRVSTETGRAPGLGAAAGAGRGAAEAAPK